MVDEGFLIGTDLTDESMKEKSKMVDDGLVLYAKVTDKGMLL